MTCQTYFKARNRMLKEFKIASSPQLECLTQRRRKSQLVAVQPAASRQCIEALRNLTTAPMRRHRPA